MKKAFFGAALIAAAVFGLVLFENVQVGSAQVGTSVSGIISQNTTWTEANSPYNLTGSVAVNIGVTLTIEPGVIVNGGTLLVNGTLLARGTALEKIVFRGFLKLIFGESSTSWSSETMSGSLVENASFKYGQIDIKGGGPLISSCIVDNGFNYPGLAVSIAGGSPEITDSLITGLSITGGSPIISNNVISQGSPSAAIMITNNSGASTIMGNNISSQVFTSQTGIITSSTVYPCIQGGNNVSILNNVVSGGSPAITINSGNIVGNNIFNSTQDAVILNFGLVSGNTIYNNLGRGIKIVSGAVSNNLIYNCTGAFGIGIDIANGTVVNNTIRNNYLGILASGEVKVNNNNIENNQWSLDLGSGITLKKNPNNLNAAYNWWGTIDVQAINQSIYDFKNDFSLGSVAFVPFLTAPNPQALPSSVALVPTSSPLPSSSALPSPSVSGASPSPTSTVPEFPAFAVIPILVILVICLGLIKKRMPFEFY